MNNILKTIEYADYSWNPITGCKNSCEYCYARSIANRFKGTKAFPNGFEPTFHPERLIEPYKFKKSSKIFVCNMSDMMAIEIPYKWVKKILKVIKKNPQHTFLILTKISGGYTVWQDELSRLKNIWCGISITKQEDAYKIFPLLKLPNHIIKFISFEPLLEFIDINLEEINWIIIGGQTGRKPFIPPVKWIAKLDNQAEKLGIPVFLKSNLKLDFIGKKEFPKRR